MFLKYNTWQDFRCIELAQLEFALKTENNLRGTGDRTNLKEERTRCLKLKMNALYSSKRITNLVYM